MLLRPRTQVVPVEHGADRLVGDLVLPVRPGPHPLVVTVFGSGPGGRYAYDWPQRFAAAGFAFYSYDRPGCGESTGDWRAMGFTDRAAETRAVVDGLARHPEIDPDRIALFGGSQGGWVAPLAATIGPQAGAAAKPAAAVGGSPAVAAVVTFSGPGVTPAVQEGYRITNALRAAGLPQDVVDRGVAAIHRMQGDLRAGRPAGDILRELRGEGAAWLPHLVDGQDSEADLEFVRRILDYDPLPALRALRCPYLAIFGACDTLVPVDESVRVIGSTLAAAGHPDHHIVVFPDADHGIRPVGRHPEPEPAGGRTPGGADRAVPVRAAGFFELIVGWLTRRLGMPRG